MTRLFIRAALFTIVFATLLMLVRGIGARAKNPLADMFTEITLANGQKQLCWQGVCPGLTTSNEAKGILDKHLTFDALHSTDNYLCWNGDHDLYGVCLTVENGQVILIAPYFPVHDEDGLPRADPSSVRLGDLITLWGRACRGFGAYLWH